MERLADILADMLRSALAWEKDHGPPSPPHGANTEGGLTVCPSAYTLASQDGSPGGAQNDHGGNDQNPEPHQDL